MSGFIVGLLILSMVTVGLGVFMGDLNKNYQADFDDNLDVFNKLTELQNTVDQTRTSLNELKTTSSLADIVGKFFASTYASLQVSFASVTTFESIATSSFEKINIGDSTINTAIQTTLTTAVFVIIFIGIIISAIFKWRT